MKTIIYILVSLILNGFILSYILDIRLIDHDLIPIKEPPIMQEETSKLPEVEKIDQSGAPYENTVKVSALDSICMLVQHIVLMLIKWVCLIKELQAMAKNMRIVIGQDQDIVNTNQD